MTESGKPAGSQETRSEDRTSDRQDSALKEGVDYYINEGLMVFTAAFLQKRGYCCESGCRHCPYGYVATVERKKKGMNSLPPGSAEG